MKKGNRSKIKIILRVLGILLGASSIAFAVFPVAMSTANIVVFLFVGVIFIAYGLTGKSSVKEWLS